MTTSAVTLAHDAPGTLTPAFQPAIELPYCHPNDMPRLYALICDGKCMEPVYRHGQMLAFSTSEPWRSGDIVAVYRHPFSIPRGQNPVILKRLVSAPPPSFFKQDTYRCSKQGKLLGTVRGKVIVRELNPARSLVLNADEVVALHKCLGPIEEFA